MRAVEYIPHLAVPQPDADAYKLLIERPFEGLLTIVEFIPHQSTKFSPTTFASATSNGILLGRKGLMALSFIINGAFTTGDG